MSVIDILPEDFLENLPEDNREAFGKIVAKAMAYLRDARRDLNENESSDWDEYRTAEHQVMNVILASAKRLEIDHFAEMEVPYRSNFSSDEFTQFRADLDHYITQIMLDNSMRKRRSSVSVDPKVKDRIRSYLYEIRKQIDAAQMTDGKRTALLERLAQFESELEKARLPIVAISRILVEMLSIGCNVLALSDSNTFQRLVHQAFQAVAEAKASEDDKRELPPSTPPAILLPPRSEEKRRKGPTESYDLNDDIPF